ncbi:DUF2382 domain-containing protein [Sphingosinithalassobacter sp. LHW66-3]|uniref:YsnF/AvaK domain-containing protein n=1 Tax=Sphingosinithalassobacter sp. LHW66-3 TaxID=3424718 RepID=UPI003D6C25A3
MRHDRRYEKLDSLSNYKLEHKSQDIRGYPLVSPEGRQFGVIDDLLVGPDHDRVVAVRLEDGRCCAVEPLEIHDNVVVYGEAARAFAARDNQYGSAAVVEEERIPVVEERVAIGKRVASGGDVITVHKGVHAETVSEDVHLRDESVSVEKRPVNERVSSERAEALLNEGDRTVSMTERDEEAVVAKDAVVTDEVVVRKTAEDKVDRVTETVRKTDVDVEKGTRRHDDRT